MEQKKQPIVRNLYKRTLALAAYRSSVMLAKERGAFEIFDAKREEKNPFINRLREADPALYEDMLKYGVVISLA